MNLAKRTPEDLNGLTVKNVYISPGLISLGFVGGITIDIIAEDCGNIEANINQWEQCPDCNDIVLYGQLHKHSCGD